MVCITRWLDTLALATWALHASLCYCVARPNNLFIEFPTKSIRPCLIWPLAKACSVLHRLKIRISHTWRVELRNGKDTAEFCNTSAIVSGHCYNGASSSGESTITSTFHMAPWLFVSSPPVTKIPSGIGTMLFPNVKSAQWKISRNWTLEQMLPIALFSVDHVVGHRCCGSVRCPLTDLIRAKHLPEFTIHITVCSYVRWSKSLFEVTKIVRLSAVPFVLATPLLVNQGVEHHPLHPHADCIWDLPRYNEWLRSVIKVAVSYTACFCPYLCEKTGSWYFHI